jgi:hypothetical protein
MKTDPKYGAVHIRRLTKVLRLAQGEPPLPEWAQQFVGDALKFLRRRLTDAAKAGCHHCDEGEPGQPCHWCGLRTTRSTR